MTQQFNIFTTNRQRAQNDETKERGKAQMEMEMTHISEVRVNGTEKTFDPAANPSADKRKSVGSSQHRLLKMYISTLLTYLNFIIFIISNLFNIKKGKSEQYFNLREILI